MSATGAQAQLCILPSESFILPLGGLWKLHSGHRASTDRMENTKAPEQAGPKGPQRDGVQAWSPWRLSWVFQANHLPAVCPQTLSWPLSSSSAEGKKHKNLIHTMTVRMKRKDEL